MKSNVIPIYSVGQNCILNDDKTIDETTVLKNSVVQIIGIELSDSKFANLDEIYLVDYIDYTFWVEQSELSST